MLFKRIPNISATHVKGGKCNTPGNTLDSQLSRDLRVHYHQQINSRVPAFAERGMFVKPIKIKCRQKLEGL